MCLKRIQLFIGWSVLQMSIRSMWWVVLCKSSASLCTFCLIFQFLREGYRSLYYCSNVYLSFTFVISSFTYLGGTIVRCVYILLFYLPEKNNSFNTIKYSSFSLAMYLYKSHFVWHKVIPDHWWLPFACFIFFHLFTFSPDLQCVSCGDHRIGSLVAGCFCFLFFV